MVKKGLGRGLDALLADNSSVTANSGISMIRISDIEPNKSQARKKFDSAALEELASSIGQHGLVQPIVARQKPNGFYEIIAGERRWRASKMAGLTEIPVIVKEIDDETSCLLSLIENLQRENLNPVEEANGYRDLMDVFDLTQEEAAKKVGKSRAAVANLLRILNLPESVLNLVSDGELSYGHARTLLPLVEELDTKTLEDTAKSIITLSLSVRETEKMVKRMREEKDNPPSEKSPIEKTYYKQLENRLGSTLGRHAAIKASTNGTGHIMLTYSSSDDLEQLIKSLCGKEFFEEN
ncbi:MAG: ParB/RepB/Spo0J family partition protein [Clostridia bacterium]